MTRNTTSKRLAAATAAMLMTAGLAVAGETQEIDQTPDDRGGLQQAFTAGQGADGTDIDFTGGDQNAVERALTAGAGSDTIEIDMNEPDRGGLQRALTAGEGADRVEIAMKAACSATRAVQLWMPFNVLKVRVSCN